MLEWLRGCILAETRRHANHAGTAEGDHQEMKFRLEFNPHVDASVVSLYVDPSIPDFVPVECLNYILHGEQVDEHSGSAPQLRGTTEACSRSAKTVDFTGVSEQDSHCRSRSVERAEQSNKRERVDSGNVGSLLAVDDADAVGLTPPTTKLARTQ
eukprot:7437438-Pyramimonas_sp.AAC.1